MAETVSIRPSEQLPPFKVIQMNDRSTLMKNVGIALGVLTLLFGLMFVAEVGIGETVQIVTDPDQVDAATNATNFLCDYVN